MANSSLTLSSLDFDTLKNNFKEFLKTQSVFKDYNFDGSNISVLLDVMSYNSYLNSFYLNMVASEMFLDSAQKYDSIVSHAKELNYVPRSSVASVANISFTITTDSTTGKFTIPKGTIFSGLNSNGSYTFVTSDPITYTSGNAVFTANNLQIYEGSYFTDSYVVDYDIEDQKYVLSNKNIDISSIKLTVKETPSSTSNTYTRAENLYGLNGLSEVYFLQPAQNNLYEVVFGDGLFGKKPINGATISVNYLVTNGSDGNGIDSFTISEDLGPYNLCSASLSDITVITESNSGANQESIDSVKFAAPRYFATQQRAVSSDDYTSLVKAKFGGDISDVVVFGGQEMEPKLYGRVIVCLKPTYGTIAPDYLKNKIEKYLLDYIALPNRVKITDPEYLYIGVDTIVQYNSYTTDKSSSEINSIVMNSIINYSSNNLEMFANDLRYSKLASTIDDSDTSITSNQTTLRIIKRISPKIDYPTSYDVDVNNVLYYEGQTKDVGIPHTELYTTSFDVHVEHSSLISSQFTYLYNDVLYNASYIADDGAGILKVYTIVNNIISPLEEVGTIDYTGGTFKLNNFRVQSYNNYISLYLKPRDLDIYADMNKIILIDPNDVTITITEMQK